ncbi:hypothetical protein F5Y06DRAFT_300001 [Hypoxylon sp. FL0890]|nr:hypothetical protein F5Y06DRAFT_300001 [Hypoxylon sp. FL0890]
MSSTSRSNSDIQSQYIGDDLEGHNRRLSQPYSGQNGLPLQPLLTTSIPPFTSNIYPLASSGFIDPPNLVGEGPSQPAATPLAHHTSWSSGVQSLPQRVGIQPVASGTPVSLPEAPPMRYFHNDLPVLSAEQYDDGRYSRRPRPAAKAAGKPNTRIVPIGNAPNPRKRGRKTVDDEQRESAEEPKRTRGRPRLETKDQTPTERRRTQIRLAQRAYRNRKENAITDLQAKINDLKEVNNEINNAYQNLFDYASQRGLLAQAPEFGQQLQRLQSLIKQTQKEDSPKPGEEDGPEGDSDSGAQDSQRIEDTAVSNEEPVPTLPEAQTTHLWAGLTVTHEPIIQQDALTASSNLDPALNNPQLHQYEIVTAPTPENASFGPNLSIDMDFTNPAYSSWAQHPWNRLTGPRTMSFTEWAFARRLHRHATERAWLLISMPNPPPAKMSRVFGFVMLFETVDEIRARTRAALSRTRDQSLSYWEHPFHRLGGSGTHFPENGPSSLSGSSNYQSSGFGTGPFNERTTRVRDTLLGVSQYINMSGWEGTWFDSGEVETYLAQNGVVIPTAADIHTLDVPAGAFSDVETQPQVQLMQSIPSNAMSMAHADQSLAPGMSSDIPPAPGGVTFSAESNASSTGQGLPLAHDDSWPPLSVTSNLYGATPTTDGSVPSFTGFDNMAANVFPDSSSYLLPHQEPAVTAPVTKRVVLDVNKFIGGRPSQIPALSYVSTSADLLGIDLISHATCLGRAPSFRPKDIAKTFWGAVISD